MKTWKLNIEQPPKKRVVEKPSPKECEVWRFALGQEDDIPAGFKNSAWWFKAWNKGSRTGYKLMHRLLELKKLEQRFFLVRFNGRLRKVPHYRLL